MHQHTEPTVAPNTAQTGPGRREFGRGRSGRDRRHHSTLRRWRVNASFSDDEHAAVAAAAARSGLTVTGYVATAAVTAANQHGGVVAGSDRFEALAGLQAELFHARTALNRAGGNLNQAVTVLHASGQPPVWLASAVRLVTRAVAALDEVVTRVDRRLR